MSCLPDLTITSLYAVPYSSVLLVFCIHYHYMKRISFRFLIISHVSLTPLDFLTILPDSITGQDHPGLAKLSFPSYVAAASQSPG